MVENENVKILNSILPVSVQSLFKIDSAQSNPLTIKGSFLIQEGNIVDSFDTKLVITPQWNYLIAEVAILRPNTIESIALLKALSKYNKIFKNIFQTPSYHEKGVCTFSFVARSFRGMIETIHSFLEFYNQIRRRIIEKYVDEIEHMSEF